MTGERANRATATSTKLTHRIRFGTFFARRRIKIRLFANDNDGEDPNLENIQPIKIYTLDMDIKELKKERARRKLRKLMRQEQKASSMKMETLPENLNENESKDTEGSKEKGGFEASDSDSDGDSDSDEGGGSDDDSGEVVNRNNIKIKAKRAEVVSEVAKLKTYDVGIWKTDLDMRVMRKHLQPQFINQFQDGLEAYFRGDWTKAHQVFDILAAKGDLTSTYYLGIIQNWRKTRTAGSESHKPKDFKGYNIERVDFEG